MSGADPVRARPRSVGLRTATVGVMYLLFFVSGSAGLIYEVVWLRLWTYVFGNSTEAMGTVLAAFMAGLALGSYLGGLISDRVRNGLRTYALLQIGVGLSGLAIAPLIGMVVPVYSAIYQFDPDSLVVLTAVRFLISFLILLVPTTLMGATLPVLSRALTPTIQTSGSRVSFLYALNTLGALTGCVLTGYLFIELLGVAATTQVAVVINLGVAVAALAWSLGQPTPTTVAQADAPGTPPSDVPDPTAEAPTPAEPFSRIEVTCALVAAAVAGMTTMIYEVAWSRLIALTTGSSVYSFVTMLATVLAGIALGSWIIGRRLRTRDATWMWLATTQAVVGLVTFLLVCVPGVSLPEVGQLLMIAVAPSFEWSFGYFQAAIILFCALLFLIPTTFMGMTFPIVNQMVSRRMATLGRSVGKVYAINTVGSIVGSVLGGFVLIGLLWTQGTLKLAIVVNLALALLLAAIASRSAWRGRLVLAVLCVGAIVGTTCLGPWNRYVIASGSYYYGDKHTSTLWTHGVAATVQRLQQDEMQFFEDGICCTVTVMKQPGTTGSRYLTNNGKIDASSRGDMSTQLLVGYLPAMVHPDPRKAVVIGFGSGVTVGAVAQMPGIHVHCAELERAMYLAGTFFDDVNHDIIEVDLQRRTFKPKAPNFTPFVADGRNHLLLSGHTYDVIISEPTNPWIAGVGSLFTREFYQLCKRQLKPGGVMGQWVQLYCMTWDDYSMLLRTFHREFPNCLLFQVDGVDTILIASTGDEPIAIDVGRIKSLLRTHPAIHHDFAQWIAASPLSMLKRTFWLNSEEIGKLVATGVQEYQTDLHPVLDYRAPRSLYSNPLNANIDRMWRFKTSDLPPLANITQADYRRESSDLAFEYYKVAKKYAEVAVGASSADAGRVRRQTLANARRAAELAPKVPDYHHYVGVCHEDLDESAKAQKAFDQAIRLAPRFAVQVAKFWLDRGDAEKCLETAKRAVALMPRSGTAHLVLVRAYRALDKPAKAKAALDKVLKLDPALQAARTAMEEVEEELKGAATQKTPSGDSN